MIGFYNEEELQQLGFKKLGKDVRISKTATIYNTKQIEIGDHVRIDNFCVIAPSGHAVFQLGSYVHISAFNFMNGTEDITIGDFSTTAPYVRFFTSTDDYSGEKLTGAVIPKELLGTFSAPVIVARYCILGTGTTVMPGVSLAEGTAVGAHSFVNKNSEPYTIIGGTPAVFKKARSRNLSELAAALIKESEGQQ